MSWILSVPSKDQENALFQHRWTAMPEAMAKLEPRFNTRDGEFNFDIRGSLGHKSFNRIRATPDFKKGEVDVRLEYDHHDDPRPSLEWQAKFSLRPIDLSGDAEKDCRFYAARVQLVLRNLYQEHENMRHGDAKERLMQAFEGNPGTETPLLAFMDRVTAVQETYNAQMTQRIIGLSAHLRTELPAIPSLSGIPNAAGAGMASSRVQGR